MIVEDEYGKWEVTEGNGCISKTIIEPSELYKIENKESSFAERLSAIETLYLQAEGII